MSQRNTSRGKSAYEYYLIFIPKLPKNKENSRKMTFLSKKAKFVVNKQQIIFIAGNSENNNQSGSIQ